MDLPSLTTVPSVRTPASGAAHRPRANAAARRTFPRVDAAAQRSRDSDRKRMLRTN